MGIQGLIPLLEKSWKSVNVSEFSGCTVAVDAYCWLHKGVYTCAEKLARGEDCQAYVYYCMRFVSMLLAKNIKPILVFDGQHLPAKADTESKRRKLREQNRKKAAELMRLDKGKEASSLLRRSIDVTHNMALNLIKQCREINVDCIVAPYEADSQLAYLNLSGIADIVITEDSDLLLFGCKRVLFKLDQNGGGLLIEQEKLYLSMNIKPEQFNFNKFRYMCILSGCDYLPSIPGVGLVKARQFITRTSEPDIYKSLMRLGSFMNTKVPPEYRDQFMDADRMFQYQPVYDPLSRQVIPLNKILDPDLPPVLASKLNGDQAYQLALGNIDPISLEVMDDWDPDINLSPNQISKSKIIKARHKSIWSKDYQTTKYEPNVCTLTQEIISCTPTVRKVTKNVTQSLPMNEPTIIKKRPPVTENDILSTLEEIYENEKVLKEDETIIREKHQSKKSTSNKNSTIIETILSPELDDTAVENEAPISFTQLAKRKYTTVINSEKRVISGYFSAQTPKSSASEVVEKECINPFKCRKITFSKNDDTMDNSYSSFDSSNIIEQNKLQCLENEKVVEIETNMLHKKTHHTTQKASFSWKNYSCSKTVTSVKLCDEKNGQKTILQNSQNDSIFIIDDNTKQADSDKDIDEGFCSQNTKDSNDTNFTLKRSYPRTGLSKSTGKSNQTLLSKFGFKASGQLEH